MSKQTKAGSGKRPTETRTAARDVLLAGIGAASLLRKNANQAIADASAAIDHLPVKTADFADAVAERTHAFRIEFSKRIVPSLGRRVKAMATEGVASVESRLQPLLKKLGVKTSAAKTGKRRKTAAKSTAKRTVRKPRKAA
jgi:hypothetical protein